MIWLIVLATFLALLAGYIYTAYLTWKEEFGSNRLTRGNEQSPSYGNPPIPMAMKTQRDMVSLRAAFHDHAEVDDYKNSEELMKSDADEVKSHAGRTRSFSPKGYGSVLFNTFGKSYKYSIVHEGQRHAAELNMDHQYLPFKDYLWAIFFVGHNALVLWLKGCIGLMIRDKLMKLGWLEPQLMDPAEIASKLVMESSLAMNFVGIREEGGKKIGGFFYPEFPIVKADSSFEIMELLSVDIDLEKKRMISCKLDDRELTAEEAIILLWYYTVSAQHVKLHALSNWAINMEPKQVEKNPFPAQNSLVTTIYNYFGYTAFVTFFSSWRGMGLLSPQWDIQAWLDTVCHGIETSFFAHPIIREIAPYSEFVDFHVKLRPSFMKRFATVKHKYFPGCHGEALFVGTIMHSLDHQGMDWNLEDPLWLDTSHPEYGRMAEIGRIVKVGFVKDLPGLLIHKRYKGSKHPFYDGVYQDAAKINLKYADKMDTCIVK